MDATDFGRYLSQQRELRGMTREEVAHATKIPLGLVVALEEGNLRRLPGRVFAINYVRAYALVIGLAPEEAVLRYEEVDGAPLPEAPESLERARRRRSLLTALGVAGVILLCVLLFLLLNMNGAALR